MTKWFAWLLLSALTGSPLIAAVIVLVAYFALDRFTLGLLPDPLRWFNRLQRRGKLRRKLDHTPFDRKSRSELAELELDLGNPKVAYETLKPNLDAGDSDVYTLYTLGVAAYRSGNVEEGEALLGRAQELDERFRLGAIDLELGRGRLAAGKLADAVGPLERFLKIRTSSVEGKVLLSRAKAGLGDADAAAKLKDSAWRDHASAPAFQRRQQRWWAWRARSSRPALYLAVAIAAMFVLRAVVPWQSLLASRSVAPPAAASDDYDD